MAAAECFMYSVSCQSGQCQMTRESVAKEMGIFFTTGEAIFLFEGRRIYVK